jgi:hypothetical protein
MTVSRQELSTRARAVERERETTVVAPSPLKIRVVVMRDGVKGSLDKREWRL